MRAILIGLLGVVLGLTETSAGACKPEGAKLSGEDGRVLTIVKSARGDARIERGRGASRLLLAVKLGGKPYLLDLQAIPGVMSSVMTSDPGHKPGRFPVMPRWRPSDWTYDDGEVLVVSGGALSGQWKVSCPRPESAQSEHGTVARRPGIEGLKLC